MGGYGLQAVINDNHPMYVVDNTPRRREPLPGAVLLRPEQDHDGRRGKVTTS